jgi:hypothetical protein
MMKGGTRGGRQSYSGREGGGGGGEEEEEDFVPAQEYDELSKLCDRLLSEQEQLQLEVKKQADMLKALKAGAGGVRGAGAGGVRGAGAGAGGLRNGAAVRGKSEL